LSSGQGIGFATPSNMAKEVIPQLKAKGKVTRGMLGIEVQTVTNELAKSFGLSEAKGALVAEVNPGSPAEKGGIHRGDIIIEFNGHPIHEMNDLPRLVAETAPGTRCSVKVLRNGKEESFNVTVAELTGERQAAQEKEEGGGEASALGLQVENITPELAKRYHLRGTTGVLVEGVQQGSIAALAGIRPGDLVLEVNDHAIKNVKDFATAMGRLKEKGFARFLIKRQDRTLYLAVEVAK
jgi:serine protease Do